MSKTLTKRTEMRAEYGLASISSGVRGKYYQDYHAGHTVRI